MPAERLGRTGAPPRVGIVHLGLGAFFRAHGAIYTQEAMARSGGDWGILGVSLRSPATRDQLVPQGGVYTALELGPEGATAQRIQSVTGVLLAPEDPAAVIAAMADPAVRIVTLTVTEKGYCHEPSTGGLKLDHPDISHDIGNSLPVSAPGFLVRALEQRRAAGLRPFTVLTCDNLPRNGRIVRDVVLALAQAVDPSLAAWIAAEGRFPSTMVDRIVPATRPEDVATVMRLTGQFDAAPVVHEPFRQWVIEDDFVADERPAWAEVGAQLVADVTPFEHMKLRMLNGTHSSLAYLGYLAGYETIADTMADPVFAAFVARIWRDEIIPVLAAPAGTSLPAYAKDLAARYANSELRHRTWQIAMDGSQKLPQRILGTLSEARAAGRVCPGLVLAVAAWMRYVGGIDESGRSIDVRDPMADRLKALWGSTSDPHGKAAALLSVAEVFPPDLASWLRKPVSDACARLVCVGARAAVQEVLR